jgi:hypothetical protein
MNLWPIAIVNLKSHASLLRCFFEYITDDGYKMSERCLLSLVQLITLSLSKLSLLQRMTSNDNNGKRKLEEEAESSTARKRLWLSDDDTGDDDSSDSLEEMEVEEEVSSEETSMNDQLNTFEEKLQAKHTRGIVFDDDGDTTSPSSEPRTPECRRCSDKDSSDDNDDNDNDFWM